MQKIFAIILVALFAVSCTGSKGCGCPSWGFTPIEIQDDITVQVLPSALFADEFVWN